MSTEIERTALAESEISHAQFVLEEISKFVYYSEKFCGDTISRQLPVSKLVVHPGNWVGSSMKILLVNNFYAPNVLGGAERSVQFLAEGLATAGEDVSVASLNTSGETAEGEVNNVAVHYLRPTRFGTPQSDKTRSLAGRIAWHVAPSFDPTVSKGFAQLLDREKPDIVHTNNLAGMSPAVWKIASDSGAAVVHTLRDYYTMCPRGTMYRNDQNCRSQCLTCSVYTTSKKHLTSYVDVVVGNSAFILEQHVSKKFFPSARKRVIYSAYEPVSPPQKFPASNGALRLGYMGRLHPTKGVDMMLESLLKASTSNWSIVLGGTGAEAYEAELKQRFNHSHVRFSGWIRPEALLAEIDVLIVPSRWHEPLPRTIYEAYGNGVPVIAAKRGGIPEIVDHGVTGWLYDPDNPDELAQILTDLTNGKLSLRGMAEACLSMSTNFRPETCVSNYMSAYTDAISDRSRNGH